MIKVSETVPVVHNKYVYVRGTSSFVRFDKLKFELDIQIITMLLQAATEVL